MLHLNKIAMIVFLLLAAACKKTTVVDAANFIRYVDAIDNGLIQEYKNDNKGLKISAQYKPAVYLAIKELGPDAFHPDTIMSLAQEFQGGYHFSLTVSSTVSGYDVIKEKLSPNDYLKRITYLTGEIRNDFKLLAGLDTIPCAVAHYERNYNISPDNKFLLVFPYSEKSNEDLTLIYDDKVFGEGKLEFRIKNRNIKKIPKLL